MSQVSSSTRRKPVVRFERKGNRLLIPRLSRGIRRVVQEELTYNYLKFHRGRGKQRTEVIPTECFVETSDPDKILPNQVLTCAGYLPRLTEAFQAAGYRITLSDNSNPRPKKADKVLWDRLDSSKCRWRQEECIRKILSSDFGRVRCPTGYGKSWIIGKLAQLLPYARIDVTTHSKDVLEMLYEDLCGMLPSVGIVTGSRKEYGKRVMCYSGKSLHHSDHKAHWLFVDEVHEFATQDYMDRVVQYSLSRNFGFSANGPGDRPDNADFELEGLFGPELINIPYQEAVDHDCIVQIKVMWIDVIMDVNPAADSLNTTQKLRHGIWRNKIRNEKIAAVAHHFLEAGKQVLILVDTVDHACFLKKLLPEFELVYGEGNLKGDDRRKFVKWNLISEDEPLMTSQRRLDLKHQFEDGRLRGAIATGVWNRGVNFRHLQVMIRADAKTSPIADAQMPGRLSRLDDDKRYGLMVDFHDQFDKSLQRRATERKRRYRANSWDQVEQSQDGTLYSQGRLFTR